MAYRDEDSALAHREATLAQALDHCDEELSRLRTLEQRRRSIARELHDVRSRRSTLEEGGEARELDVSEPASPCPARWELMDGGGRVRSCHRCGKRVYDLDGVDEAEATAWLLEREGALALGRLRRRADGTLIAGDCPVGAIRARRRRAVVGGGTAAMVAAAMAVAASAPTDAPRTTAAMTPDQRVDPQGLDGAPAHPGELAVDLDDEIAIEPSP